MKTKFLHSSLILLLGMNVFYSCSEDESSVVVTDLKSSIKTQKELKSKGRFDNQPFKWDYSFSTDPSNSVLKDEILLDHLYSVEEVLITKGQRPPEYDPRRGRGGDSRRTTITPRRTSPSKSIIDATEILINNPSFIYVGAAFPESEFAKNFGKEIVYPRNSMEISANFQDPYLDEITKETGSFGYKKFMKRVLKSDEYKDHISRNIKESLDFQCTEFYSYFDIQKSFSSNASLGKLFSARVESNSRNTEIKGRLFGRLISKNFTVAMETPAQGFFKNRSKDSSSENPVFVRSVSYGKIAFIAVESEYSFTEIKNAIEAGIKWKLFSGSGSYSKHDIEVLQKSTITLYVLTDDTNGGANQYFNSLDNILDAFKVSYTSRSTGILISCKGQYTKDLSIFEANKAVSTGRREDSSDNRTNRTDRQRYRR